MPEQLWQALSYASIIAAAATLLIAFASMVLLATYLRDKSKSRYDEVHHRAEISEMRRSYEDHLKALTLQLTATDQRWKDLNHLLISSQRFEPKVQVADDRASNWRVGRHNTGAVAFYPSPSIPDGALDASELFLTGELWANDFYFLDPTKERVRQRGFPFVPTGAVEEVLVDTLRNFIAIARDKMAIKVPVQVKTGLVGVHGFRLAVPPEYFAFSEMEGHILREAIVFETSLGDWSTHPFDILKPFFETIYDAAGLKRPDVRVAGRLQQ